MKRNLKITALVLCTFVSSAAHGQDDDDHTITNPGGVTYLAPNDSATSAVAGFTVGTAPSTAAALVVRGNQMATPTGLVFSSFASYTATHSWDMNKILQNGTTETIGRISNPSGNGSKTFDIDARSDNLRFLTNQVIRAALFYRVPDASINGQPAFNQSGYFGLSRNPNFITTVGTTGGSPGPFSLFHMVDAGGGTTTGTYAPTLGFRGWMRNGITFTGNSDQMYIGHKYGGNNGSSQAVLQWSDATLDSTRQSLRFIFTTTPTTGSGAVAADGLEIMRLWPETNTSGYVGIGDFATATSTPTERLDLLNRTIRLQRLIPDYLNDTLSRVVVVDINGRMHWRHVNTITGSGDCEWTMPTGTGAGTNHVSTAYGGAATDCPDAAEAVGIGTNLAGLTPTAKLGVTSTTFVNAVEVTNSLSAATTKGISITTSAGTSDMRGISVSSTGAGTATHFGYYGLISGNAANTNYGAYMSLAGGTTSLFSTGYGTEVIGGAANSFSRGLFAKVHVDAAGAENYGVQALACGNDSTEINYGVWGHA